MDLVFVNGLFVNKRNEKTPDWVVASLSIKANEFCKFVGEHVNGKGFVNIEIRTAKGDGKQYAVLNTFEPKQEGETESVQQVQKQPIEQINASEPIQESLPF